MSDWVEAELVECQRHDVRHTKRLARFLGRLSARPVSRIPTACHGWAKTGAAYRFLDNPDIGVQEILSGHTHATLERIRAVVDFGLPRTTNWRPQPFNDE